MRVTDTIEGWFCYEYRWPACVLLLALAPIWLPCLIVAKACFWVADRCEQ